MPNPMLTDRDKHPTPIYRVLYQGNYIAFYHERKNAEAFVEHSIPLGFYPEDFEIQEKW